MAVMAPPQRPGVLDLGDCYLIRLPFYPDLRDRLREIGSWDPDAHGWRVAWNRTSELAAVLDEFGLALADDARALRRVLAAQAEDPFRTMLKSLPRRLRQPVYRALLRVLHPDVGGDLEATQRLTRAWDEVVT